MSKLGNRSQERIRVGKVPFDSATLPEAVNIVLDAGKRRDSIPVRLSNAYCVALASKDAVYADLLNGPGLNFPDGTPVVWFMKARKSGDSSLSTVRGPTLFADTLALTAGAGLSNFFLGTTDETLSVLRATVSQKYPDIDIAGTYAPPFAPLTNAFIQDCYERIEESKADLIWVGLGTPKQDYVAAQLAKLLGRPCVGVGAAFDFLAGTVREAPLWMQNSGTEWIYRFASEPRRLWKRYIFGNARFLYTAVVESEK